MRYLWLLGLLIATPASARHIQIFDDGYAPTAAALNNVNVDGALFKAAWNTVEATEGVYDWSALDAQIATLPKGKLWELDIAAGAYTPQWVYDDGAQAFTFTWDQPFNFPECSTQQLPVPWDAVYQRKYFAFIDAAKRKYAKDTKLARVKITGINGETDELLLPHSNGQKINSTCNASRDVTHWNNIGYSQNRIVDAYIAFADRFGQDFPNLPLDSMIAKFGFINDGTVLPGATESAIMAACLDVENCDMQNNGWHSSQTPVANMQLYQEGSPQGSNLPSGIDTILSLNPLPVALEIEDSDITLASNQAALRQAHGTLLP